MEWAFRVALGEQYGHRADAFLLFFASSGIRRLCCILPFIEIFGRWLAFRIATDSVCRGLFWLFSKPGGRKAHRSAVLFWILFFWRTGGQSTADVRACRSLVLVPDEVVRDLSVCIRFDLPSLIGLAQASPWCHWHVLPLLSEAPVLLSWSKALRRALAWILQYRHLRLLPSGSRLPPTHASALNKGGTDSRPAEPPPKKTSFFDFVHQQLSGSLRDPPAEDGGLGAASSLVEFLAETTRAALCRPSLQSTIEEHMYMDRYEFPTESLPPVQTSDMLASSTADPLGSLHPSFASFFEDLGLYRQRFRRFLFRFSVCRNGGLGLSSQVYHVALHCLSMQRRHLLLARAMDADADQDRLLSLVLENARVVKEFKIRVLDPLNNALAEVHRHVVYHAAVLKFLRQFMTIRSMDAVEAEIRESMRTPHAQLSGMLPPPSQLVLPVPQLNVRPWAQASAVLRQSDMSSFFLGLLVAARVGTDHWAKAVSASPILWAGCAIVASVAADAGGWCRRLLREVLAVRSGGMSPADLPRVRRRVLRWCRQYPSVQLQALCSLVRHIYGLPEVASRPSRIMDRVALQLLVAAVDAPSSK